MAAASTRTAPAWTTVAVTTWRTAVLPVVVRLVGGFVSAFEGHRNAFALGWRFSSAHLGTLLLQDCLARQLDAIAFDGQHLHQDLIAFLQFVANVGNAVFRDFTDVQQSVGAWNDLDKRSEVRQA